MSWINVSRDDLNEMDIFAFVNLKEDILVKGRLFTAADLTKCILAMNDTGAVTEAVPLPEWALYSLEEDILHSIFEEIAKLPGADLQNKSFNIKNGNYTPEQVSSVAYAVLNSVVETPTVVILKYVPDLVLSKEDMKEFIF